MQKLQIVILIFFTVSLISFAQSEKYGKEIELTEKTLISDILADPLEYVGKTVLVEGEIAEVCAMAGCWMKLKSDKVGDIRIKVKDGEIVFPVEAKGSNALVEGTVYAIEFTQEEAVDYLKHMAEDAGEEFDESSVTGPMTLYQIRGLGAQIN
jgi:hypothetical protein